MTAKDKEQSWEPSWVQCEDCDDFWCEQHDAHAADCTCPAIEEWIEHDSWPYKEDPL